jgi:hypothetical protein
MHPKRWFVKFTTVLLPFLCFAVERRVKNKFCLPLTKENTSPKFLLRKENAPRAVYGPSQLRIMTNNRDSASRPPI